MLIAEMFIIFIFVVALLEHIIETATLLIGRKKNLLNALCYTVVSKNYRDAQETEFIVMLS